MHKHVECKSDQFFYKTSFTALLLVVEKENFSFAIIFNKFFQHKIHLIYISTYTYKIN